MVPSGAVVAKVDAVNAVLDDTAMKADGTPSRASAACQATASGSVAALVDVPSTKTFRSIRGVTVEAEARPGVANAAATAAAATDMPIRAMHLARRPLCVTGRGRLRQTIEVLIIGT